MSISKKTRAGSVSARSTSIAAAGRVVDAAGATPGSGCAGRSRSCAWPPALRSGCTAAAAAFQPATSAGAPDEVSSEMPDLAACRAPRRRPGSAPSTSSSDGETWLPTAVRPFSSSSARSCLSGELRVRLVRVARELDLLVADLGDRRRGPWRSPGSRRRRAGNTAAGLCGRWAAAIPHRQRLTLLAGRPRGPPPEVPQPWRPPPRPALLRRPAARGATFRLACSSLPPDHDLDSYMWRRSVRRAPRGAPGTTARVRGGTSS